MARTENSHKSQGFAHIGLVVVALIVAAAVALGGWYVWQSNREDKDNNKSNTSQTNNKKQDELRTAPDGWKFYENNEAGFSFYYPPKWGEIQETELDIFEFSLIKVSFEAHTRDLSVDSLEFGNIEPAVIDVYLENGEPIVELVSGFETFRDFTNDQVVKKFDNDKICLAEDYFADDYVNNPDLTNSYRYFAYCGLADVEFGAFTVSSGQLDSTKPETQDLKGEINKLIETFEIF